MAKIIIIEDNPANLELMSYLLTAFGHEVFTSVDGKAGMDLVRKTQADLIICDVQLPVADGYEVARVLKADARFASIPLIAVTALAMVGDRERGLRAGFNGYIFKPIEPENFVKEVETFLDQNQHGSAPRQQAIKPGYVNEPGSKDKAKILVVDDSTINLELFRDIFEPLGYTVWLGHGVQDGYEKACNKLPDLIISDLHMPGEDGFDLFQRIKSRENLAKIPFVLISSTVRGKKDYETARKLGISLFLTRPIEPEILISEIVNTLRRYRE